MKKFIMLLLSCTMICTQVPAVNALENNISENPEITNVNIKENLINCQADGEKMTYDLDNEVITMGDTKVYLKTTVDYINDDVDLTEDQLLELDKEMIKEKFLSADSDNGNVSLFSTTNNSLSPQVPSNAKYVVACKFSKQISKIIAEIDSVASKISKITGILTALGVIPKTSIINMITSAYDKSKAVFKAINLTVTGTWKYNLERTTQAYTAGNTKLICYRYAHSGLLMNVSCKFGKKPINKTQSKKGGWWVSSKPY